MREHALRATAAVLLSAGALLLLIALLQGTGAGAHPAALAAPSASNPTVTDVAPAAVANHQDAAIVITGTGFTAELSGTQVLTPPTVLLDSTVLPDVGWVASTTLTATVPAGFPVGVYTVTVENPDGATGSLANALTVHHPAPELEAVDPVSGTWGQVMVITVTGSHFVPTPTITLGSVPCLNIGFVSSTTLTATVPGDLLPGTHDLVVHNPGPEAPQDTLPDAFTLYSPQPTVTEVEPRDGPNDLDTTIVITGTDFVPTPTVTLADTPLEHVTWVSHTRLTAQVPWGMDPDTYDLHVINPGPNAPTAGLTDAFTVTEGIGVWNAGELYGGNVDRIVLNPITPTTLYAVANDVGLFRSRDGGDRWSFNVSSIFVEDLAIDPARPKRMYRVGTPHSGGWLYHSENGGDSWVPITTTSLISQTSGRECYARYRLYATADTVYASACGMDGGERGLIRSDDQGETWTPLMNGLTDTQVTELAFHPADPMTMYAGTANGNVFVSHSGGVTWTFASQPLDNIYDLVVNPRGDHEVWAATGRVWTGDPCGIVKSTNADLTAWEPLPSSVYEKCGAKIIFPPEDWSSTFSRTVFVEDYKSTDGGESWEPFGPGDSAVIRAVHPTDPEVIYFGHSGSRSGIHRTTDGGQTWESTSRGLTGIFPWSLEIVPDQPDIVFAGTNVEAVFKGTGGGRAWKRLPIPYGGGRGGSIRVDPMTSTRVYAGSGGVHISDDLGETWPTFVAIEPPDVYSQCGQWVDTLLPISGTPGLLLAGVQHGPGDNCVPSKGSVYRSTNYGEDWDRVYPVGAEEIAHFSDLVHDALTPTIIYAARYGESMLRSVDGGKTWDPIGADIPALDQVLSIAAEPAPPYRIVAHTETGLGKGLYVSKDHGDSWEQAGAPLIGTQIEQIRFAPTDPPILYAGAHEGLFRSTDGAQSWSRASGALGRVPVYSLDAVRTNDRVFLYAGTTGGRVGETTTEALDLSALDATADETLINAGVYRYTTRRPKRVYLPLVLRAH